MKRVKSVPTPIRPTALLRRPPVTRARLALLGVVALAVTGAVAFGGVYLTMFNPKPVARVSLPGSPAAAPTGSLPGTWKVSSGSSVGYRVREQLALLPAPTDAVGRSSAVTGGATVTIHAGGTAAVTAVKVVADLTQLASDSGRRDAFLQDNSLDTSSHPTATFTSDAGFTVPATVVSGAAGSVSVPGTFTIHGQSKAVTLTLKLQRNGATVDAVASYTFHWGDYGVQQPSVPVASVQSDPTIEISLVLTSAA